MSLRGFQEALHVREISCFFRIIVLDLDSDTLAAAYRETTTNPFESISVMNICGDIEQLRISSSSMIDFEFLTMFLRFSQIDLSQLVELSSR